MLFGRHSVRYGAIWALWIFVALLVAWHQLAAPGSLLWFLLVAPPVAAAILLFSGVVLMAILALYAWCLTPPKRR